MDHLSRGGGEGLGRSLSVHREGDAAGPVEGRRSWRALGIPGPPRRRPAPGPGCTMSYTDIPDPSPPRSAPGRRRPTGGTGCRRWLPAAQGPRCGRTWEIWTTLGQYLPHQLGPDRGEELCAPPPPRRSIIRGCRGGASVPDGGRGRGTQGRLQLGDRIAALFPGNDVSLRSQLSIGALHRDGTDLQVLRRLPPGGSRLPAVRRPQRMSSRMQQQR